MGWKYTSFRVWYELKRKSGLLRFQYPTNPKPNDLLSLKEWRESGAKFFFEDSQDLLISRTKDPRLKHRVSAMKEGVFKYFNGSDLSVSLDYPWLTNPISGHRYKSTKHWSKIPSFSSAHGDIKYVWEKSRFCYFYDLIRYDYHYQEDQSEWVFSDICSWMDANPINCGPNFTCSQEIAIRCFNWLFALYYYKNSPNLSDEIFKSIMHYIFWQMKHVRSNITFSRIAVRNNHTLTETLALYVFGMLFPMLPEAKDWKEKGKNWFEEEIGYQIYDDGTFIQYSMNYHRVVVQLLTWALLLAHRNQDNLGETVRQKAKKSLEFLLSNIDPSSGKLPNYGANDGALFFKLSEAEFRDYRPQLNALNFALYKTIIFTDQNSLEELGWYGINYLDAPSQPFFADPGIFKFEESGYYLVREQDSFTMIRCGKHMNRPSQADNLHVDIWHNGVNILRDAGSYMYNTDEEWTNFFTGTISHNTLMVNESNQMVKGPFFIWYNWSQRISASIEEMEDRFIFKGKIRAFHHLDVPVIHSRKITKFKHRPFWIVEDSIEGVRSVDLKQIWNPIPRFELTFSITAEDRNGNQIDKKIEDAWYSTTYGVKEKCSQFLFHYHGNYIRTDIRKRETTL